jgi:peptidoglycan hydrolase-like protein with peptidoglycan-binding domain
MTLFSPYFLADQQLVDCDAGTVLLQSGSAGSGVDRVQRALGALGYSLAADGNFGPDTDTAVRVFQGDQGLSVDGQIGPNTIGVLDGLMSGVPADPDAPDPSANGLTQLVTDTVTTKVLPWATAAIDWLNRWPAADQHPGDPDWDRFQISREAHLHTSTYTGDLQEAYESVLLPIYHAVKRAWDPTSPFLQIAEVEQADMRAIADGIYPPVFLTSGAVLHVAPPFRNALTDDGRASLLMRVVVRLTNTSATTRWAPTCGHYGTLTGDEAIVNAPSYPGLAFDLAQPTADVTPPVSF